MKRLCPATALAVTVFLACPVAAVAPPEIRGVVCAGDPCRGVPGLLVALYDAYDLLVDSTYSRADGRFSLRPPLAKGHSYVVVTRAESAIPMGFEFDPAVSRSLNLKEIKFAAEKGSLWDGAQPVFDWAAKYLFPFITFGFGLFVRGRIEAKVAAIYARRDLFRDLGSRIDDKLRKFPKGEPLDIAPSLVQVIAAVHDLALFLESRSGIQSELARLGPRAVKEFRDVLGRVKSIEQKAQEIENTCGWIKKAEAIRAAEVELGEIRKQLPS